MVNFYEDNLAVYGFYLQCRYSAGQFGNSHINACGVKDCSMCAVWSVIISESELEYSWCWWLLALVVCVDAARFPWF